MRLFAGIAGMTSRRGAEAPRPRRRRDAGFTLVEMLAALLVLMLLTATVATGTSTATRLYRQSLFDSQSEVLSSSLDTALADPLRFMTVTTNETTGAKTYKIVYQNNDADGTILDASPQLVAEDGNGNTSSPGYLYLVGSDGTNTIHLKVLNAGAYGTCRATVDSFDIAHGGNVVYVKYTITSTIDSSLHHTYEMSFGYNPDSGVSKPATTS